MGEIVKLEPRIGSRLETLSPIFPTVPSPVLVEKIKQTGTYLGFTISELLLADFSSFVAPIKPVLVCPDELGLHTEWLTLKEMRKAVARRHLRGLTPRMVLELLLLPRIKIQGCINILLDQSNLSGYLQVSTYPGKPPHIGIEYAPVRDQSSWFLRRP